jgi:hypothetical protein
LPPFTMTPEERAKSDETHARIRDNLERQRKEEGR